MNRLEQEGVAKVGVFLLVFSLQNHKVWVIEEKKAKKSTGKVAGRIGVPAETRKQGETICDNTRGVLVEEMGIDRNHPARANFYYVDGLSYRGRYQLRVEGKKVHADVVTLVYSGDPSIIFWPQTGEFGADEVAPVGWMEPRDLQQDKKLRFGLEYILRTGIKNGWGESLLEHWRLREIGEGNRVRRVFAADVVEDDRKMKVDVGE